MYVHSLQQFFTKIISGTPFDYKDRERPLLVIALATTRTLRCIFFFIVYNVIIIILFYCYVVYSFTALVADQAKAYVLQQVYLQVHLCTTP